MYFQKSPTQCLLFILQALFKIWLMREMSSFLFQLTKQIIIYPQSCCCCAIITLIVAWSQRKCSEWSHYLWDALLILCLHIALKMQNKSKYIEIVIFYTEILTDVTNAKKAWIFPSNQHRLKSFTIVKKNEIKF